MADAQFSVHIEHPFPTYRWFFSSGTGPPAWQDATVHFAGRIVGVNSNTITVSNIEEGDWGQFKCNIQDPSGSVVETRYALLVVRPLEIVVTPSTLTLTSSATTT